MTTTLSPPKIDFVTDVLPVYAFDTRMSVSKLAEDMKTSNCFGNPWAKKTLYDLRNRLRTIIIPEVFGIQFNYVSLGLWARLASDLEEFGHNIETLVKPNPENSETNILLQPNLIRFSLSNPKKQKHMAEYDYWVLSRLLYLSRNEPRRTINSLCKFAELNYSLFLYETWFEDTNIDSCKIIEGAS